MKDVVFVTDAQYVAGRVLEITFSDGLTGKIDYSDWIDRYPYFEPLKDNEYFKNFSLDGFTVVWPNGADIAPETLHKLALSSEIQQTG